MASSKKRLTLEDVLYEVYRVGARVFDPTVVIWAAERLANSEGAKWAKQEISRINRKRERLGVPMVFVPFGHQLF